MADAKKTISLASLNAVAACDVPFTFEYRLPDGSKSGAYLKVLGAQSKKVQSETNRLINERRQAQVQAEEAARKFATFVPAQPVEDDIAFTQRLAAVRLVGWDGIDEPWTEAAALELCQSNSDLADQVVKASNNLQNFMKNSRAA